MIGKVLLLKNGLVVVPLEKVSSDGVSDEIYNSIIISENGNPTHLAAGNRVGVTLKTPIDNSKEIEGLILDANIFWLKR